jgi:PAS domain S-box-containing protein
MSSLAFDVNALQKIPLFDSIITSLHDGVLIADDEGYIQYINTAYLRLTGVSSSDVLNKKVDVVREIHRASYRFDHIIGQSREMEKTEDRARRVAVGDMPSWASIPG